MTAVSGLLRVQSYDVFGIYVHYSDGYSVSSMVLVTFCNGFRRRLVMADNNRRSSRRGGKSMLLSLSIQV